jgi:rod shape determining protein RodA
MLIGLRDYFRNFYWPILLAMAALMVISVLAVHKAEQVDAGIAGYTGKQTVFVLVGLGAFFLTTLVHYQRIGRVSYPMFAATLVLLGVVFLLPESRGSRRWIPIAGGINLQPSELAKVTFIIALAWYLRYRDSYRRLAGLIVPFVITLVPLWMILKEPDLGTSMLLLPTLMVMLFMAGARLRHLLVIVLLGLAVVFTPVPLAVDADKFAAEADRFTVSTLGPVRFYSVDTRLAWRQRPVVPVAYCRLQIGQGRVYDLQPLSLRVMANKEYQVRRIEGWLRHDDPRILQDVGWQQHNSLMVLGSGQWFGKGVWKSASSYFQMLPDDHTDFIFSVVGGQWGIFGCASVLVLYAIIFIFGADVAVSTADPFGRLLAVGVLALLAAQIFINIGMAMGMMPVTGMTLPLVSYGGSSLLVNCVALGLLVNVGRHRPRTLAPKPFEFGEEGD